MGVFANRLERCKQGQGRGLLTRGPNAYPKTKNDTPKVPTTSATWNFDETGITAEEKILEAKVAEKANQARIAPNFNLYIQSQWTVEKSPTTPFSPTVASLLPSLIELS